MSLPSEQDADRLRKLTADEPLPPDQMRTGRDRREAGEPERVFVYVDLERVLGEDGGGKLAKALHQSIMRTKGTGEREEIKLIVQGGRVLEVVPHQERWKVLPPRNRP